MQPNHFPPQFTLLDEHWRLPPFSSNLKQPALCCWLFPWANKSNQKKTTIFSPPNLTRLLHEYWSPSSCLLHWPACTPYIQAIPILGNWVPFPLPSPRSVLQKCAPLSPAALLSFSIRAFPQCRPGCSVSTRAHTPVHWTAPLWNKTQHLSVLTGLPPHSHSFDSTSP